MKKFNTLFASCLLLFFLHQSAFASNELPIILKEAIQAYKSKGVDSFIPTLLKNSPLEHEKSILSQVNSLKQIESFYGAYLDAEHLKTINVSSSTRIIYYILNYEKGPVFGVATLYKTKIGEIVTQFNVHTTIQNIIPNDIILDLK